MKYYNYLSGGMTPQHLLAALTIAALGWACFKAISFLARDRTSQRTPAKASLGFWLRDNWQEAAAHAVLMFALVRFASEVMAWTIPDSATWLESNDPMWIYFVVGAAKSFVIEKVWKGKKTAKI
jgi:hypothetical protein